MLAHAATYRTRASGLVRATAWQARALLCEARGRQARHARRVPEGARCPRRPPGQPGQLGAARPRHPPRRRAGPPGPPARGGARASRAAGVERALARERAVPASGASPRTTRSSPETSPRCATPGVGWRTRAPRARPTASRLDEDRASVGAGHPTPDAPPAGYVGRIRSLRGRPSGRGLGRLHASWSSSTSTGCCTRWSPGPDGSAGWSSGRWTRRSRPAPSRASRCGRRHGDAPPTWTTSDDAWSRPCSATPYGVSGTGPWSSPPPVGCTRPRGR